MLSQLQFFLFVGDTNILYAESNLKSLEETLNQVELCKFCDWLTASKLTLNIKKNNFIILNFCPAQRKLTFQPDILIFDNDKNMSLWNAKCL